SLNDAGFIGFSASKPLAPLLALEEKRREEKKARASKPGKPRVPFSAPTAQASGFNMPAKDEAAYVQGLIANHVITEPFELDYYDLDDSLRDELKAQLLLNG